MTMTSAPSPTELSVVHCLRPYRGFEYDYDRVGPPVVTLGGNRPIAFSAPPNPNAVVPPAQADAYAYDEQARQNVAGYDPFLTSMVSCPIGASVLIWIPCVVANPQFVGEADSFVYVWRIMWRLRNMGDFRRLGIPWSIGQEGFGAADSSSGVAVPRVVIPAGCDSTVYIRREPSLSETNFVVQHLHAEGISTRIVSAANSVLLGLPSRPGGGTVTMQQGIVDPLPAMSPANYTQPPFVPIWTKAAGNEIGIWCYKYANQDAANPSDLTPTDWDFRYDTATGLCNNGAADAIFSALFGVGYAERPGNLTNMGVYVCWGHSGI